MGIGRGSGGDGGSGSRGGPGEAVPAGAAELLHLQPALRAARGRGTRSGAARGRHPAAERGPGGGGGGACRPAGVGPGKLQGASRRRRPSQRRAAPVTLSSSVILQRLLSARCVPGPVDTAGARKLRLHLFRSRINACVLNEGSSD